MVVISTYRYGELSKQGSGFIVNERGDIVTCYHVVESAHKVYISYIDSTTSSIAGILAVDSLNDIAILCCDNPEYSGGFLEINESLPVEGEPVVVIGSPMDYEFTVTDGIVSAIRDCGDSKTIQLNAPASHGSSGSPVINKNGRVVGIVTSGVKEDWPLINFAAPSIVIFGMDTTSAIDIADWAELTEKCKSFMVCAKEQWECNKEAAHSLSSAMEDYFDMAESFRSERKIWAKFYNKIGGFYYYLDFYEEAISPYEKAVELDELCKAAYEGLGDCYFELEKYEDAEESYRELMHCDPQNWYAHNGLGMSYLEQGHYYSAIERFENAIFLYPSYAKAHFNLGKAYLAIDDRVSALEEFDCLYEYDEELARELFDLIYENKVPRWKKQYKNFFDEDDDW